MNYKKRINSYKYMSSVIDFSYKNMSGPYRKRNNKKRKLGDFLKSITGKISDRDSSDSESEDMDDDEEVSCKDNHIYFKTGVSSESVDKLIRIIDSKNSKFKNLVINSKMIKSAEPHPLYLHITSYGGDLMACFRAIDAIKRSSIPINTIVDGHAASAGTLMSVVGKKRYMTPNSYMLIHQLSSGSIGKYWEIKDDTENCDTWMNDIYNIYLENTNMTEKELKEYLSHDLWWKTDKCIETGLVDEAYEGDDD